jgi:hypothetical protein
MSWSTALTLLPWGETKELWPWRWGLSKTVGDLVGGSLLTEHRVWIAMGGW